MRLWSWRDVAASWGEGGWMWVGDGWGWGMGGGWVGVVPEVAANTRAAAAEEAVNV